MNVPVRQLKFNGGEISPLLYGDTSHPRYGAALRLCKNWLPLPQGALTNRPGTVYKDAVVSKGRQAPFVFSNDLTYILLFTNLSVKIYRLGVLQATLATPWTEAMLPRLKWAQVGNTITLTRQGVAPQDLTYAPSTATWGLGATPLNYLFDGSVPGSAFPPYPGLRVIAYNPTSTYDIGDRVIVGSTPGAYWVSIQTGNIGNAPGTGSLFWTEAEDATHIGQAWKWAQTWILRRDADGLAFETNPRVSGRISVALGLDRPLAIALAGLDPVLDVPPGYTILFSRLYRGNNDVFGLIAEIKDLTVDYVDRGQAPDYTQQPPSLAQPFTLSTGDHYPAVVGHFDSRRYFLDSDVFPQHFWASKIGDFLRWDRPTPGSDQDSIFFALVSNVLEDIRSFVPRRSALIMTGSGEWAVSGPVSRTNIRAVQQSDWGSSWLDPLRVGIGLLFNTAKGDTVRSLFPVSLFSGEIWDGEEISWQARHFMEGHTVVSWAFQTTPYSMAWLVRDDGILLSLTFDQKREIIAWAQHDVGGIVEDVCVVPEPPEDAVYFIVLRGATRTWERLGSPVAPEDDRYAVYLDSATTFDGHVTGVTLASITGPDADGAYHVVSFGPEFLPGDVGTASVIFDPDGAAVEAKIVGYADAENVTVEAFDQTVRTDLWGIARSQFIPAQLAGSALDSFDVLGVRGLNVLADGATDTGATWDGTTLTLSAPALVVTVGLGYNSDATLLDAAHASIELRNKFKKLLRMGIQAVSSRGLWVGPNFDALWEWQQRSVGDPSVLLPGTVYFEEDVGDEFGKEGRASIRQWEPLPVTVVSILREMDVGGS